MKECIILAGGKGLRLRGQVDVPKPFLVVKEETGETLLDSQLKWLLAYDFEHIILALSRENFKYLRSNYSKFLNIPSIDPSVEEENLGTGGAIKLALDLVEEDHFYCFNIDDVAFYNPDELILSAKSNNAILIKQAELPFSVVEFDKDFRVTNYMEKPPIEKYVSTGHYYFNKKQIEPHLPEIGDLERTLLRDMARLRLLNAHVLKGRWITINTMKELLVARSHMTLE